MNRKDIMICVVSSVLGVAFVLGFILVFCFIMGMGSIIYIGIPHKYETSNLADYGHYIGNFSNKYVQDYITSFFPEDLNESFSNVVYSYRAQKNDAYAFEAYLSFEIEDSDAYADFVEQYTQGLPQSEFRYDDAYTEYLLNDCFEPGSSYDGTSVNISYAKIGKILCAPEKQEIIFVAIGVFDGGIASTDFLNVYFNRFGIDPMEYAEHSIEEGLKSPYGIPQRGQRDGLREP